MASINKIPFKVSPKAEKYIRQGHPWVFESSIKTQKKEGVAGDVAVLFDQRRNQFLAMGLYDPDSPMRIKILSIEKGMQWSQELLTQKLKTAIDHRRPILKHTDGYRLVFGESDGLPGMICDRYKNVLVLKLYSAIWIPYLEWIVEALSQMINPECIVLRLSRLLTKNQNHTLKEGQILHGTLENEEVIITEYGVRFKINVLRGHKTGFFLDHRHNRYLVQQKSKGKRVLDVFAYAGGFSVHALVGGASSATSIDISKQALELATANAELNPHKGTHLSLAGDAFILLDQLIDQSKKYDLIIIDPPAFAKSAKEVSIALSQYKRLAKKGAQLIAPNGLLILASCSSRVTQEAFYDAVESTLTSVKGNFIRELETAHDVDHPIRFAEGAYLKTAYFRRES